MERIKNRSNLLNRSKNTSSKSALNLLELAYYSVWKTAVILQVKNGGGVLHQISGGDRAIIGAPNERCGCQNICYFSKSERLKLHG